MTIFCDSQRALKAIQHLPFYKENRFLIGIIYHTARQLQEQGHPIAFYWVPAHLGVTGNEKTNLAARDRAARGGKQAERWSSLEYVKKNLIKARATELTKWHKKKIQEREASRRGYSCHGPQTYHIL